MDIMIAVAVGVFLLVAWTVGGWAIVRMGFTRDGDAAPAHDDGAARPARHGAAADPAADPHAIWREQMKAATAASGAQCVCPSPREDGAAAAGTPAPPSSPDCPIHRWDYA